ncbi:MAG TPA: hypothetical protein VHW01_05015 [Polyangiaceae bacterium]|nr:hypothetical protein [Polyangiaceae bacterium]
MTGPRVLAVRSDPAEALPRAKVAYSSLIVDQSGIIPNPQVTFSYCNQPKPVNELSDVGAACFDPIDPDDAGDEVVEFGEGLTPTGAIPAQACSQFGPNVPITKAGEPPGRPTDPDATGGYFQPVILHVIADRTALDALAETRISCGIASGTVEQLQEYSERTKPNQNPALSSVTVPTLGDAPLSEDDGMTTPLTIPRGSKQTLRASWPSCPATASCGDGICSPGEDETSCMADCAKNPVGCTGPEPYAYFDPGTFTLIDRHEAMRVSWFATAGSFDSDHTGQTADNYLVTNTDGTWTAPSDAGPVFIWVVLRDDRGGVDWKSFQVDVE